MNVNWSLLVGYDFFISYRREDAIEYARALQTALRGEDYRCFRDDEDAVPGMPLPKGIRRALDRTKVLILLVTPGVRKSNWVAQELRIFSELGRPVIPLQIGRGSEWWLDIAGESDPLTLLQQDNPLGLEEVAGATRPSAEVLEGLKRHFRHRRANANLRWVAVVLFGFLAALAAFGWWQRGEAMRERDNALSEKDRADGQAAEANRQKEIAYNNAQMATANATEAKRQEAIAKQERDAALSGLLALRSDFLDPDLSDAESRVLLAAESLKRKPGFENELALRAAWLALPAEQFEIPIGFRVGQLIFAPDSETLLIRSGTGLFAWDVATRRERWRSVFARKLISVDIRGDSESVVALDEDGTMRVLRMKDGALLKETRQGSSAEQVLFGREGEVLVAAGEVVGGIDAMTGAIRWARKLRTGRATQMAFAAHRVLVAGGGYATLFDLKIGELKAIWTSPDAGGTFPSVALSPDGRFAAFGETEVTVVDASDGEKVVGQCGSSGLALPRFLGFRADGDWLVCGFATSRGPWSTEVLATSNGKELMKEEGETGFAIGPGGWLAVALGREFQLRGVEDKRVWMRIFHRGAGEAALSPDGRWLATADTRTAKLTPVRHPFEVWRSPCEPDGGTRQFTKGGRDAFVPCKDVSRVAVSDGNRVDQEAMFDLQAIEVFVGSHDGLWQLEVNDEGRAFLTESRGYTRREIPHQNVQAGAFAPHGRLFATVGGREVQVRDASDLREVKRYPLPGEGRLVRFSPDGRTMDVIYDGPGEKEPVSARYPIHPRELLQQVCRSVTRNLTRDEWRRYAGDATPYHRTCESRLEPPASPARQP
ncbi:MAG TPA: TIR domain-containing protein [Bryobacteraceae bacterium]|nr:TIR domain-containing protein [Bryobacteraceae bacterium]